MKKYSVRVEATQARAHGGQSRGSGLVWYVMCRYSFREFSAADTTDRSRIMSPCDTSIGCTLGPECCWLPAIRYCMAGTSLVFTGGSSPLLEPSPSPRERELLGPRPSWVYRPCSVGVCAAPVGPWTSQPGFRVCGQARAFPSTHHLSPIFI